MVFDSFHLLQIIIICVQQQTNPKTIYIVFVG